MVGTKKVTKIFLIIRKTKKTTKKQIDKRTNTVEKTKVTPRESTLSAELLQTSHNPLNREKIYKDYAKMTENG